MDRDEFIKKLHPSITHIRGTENMSEETLEAINIMVEKVSKMSTKDIKNLVAESKIPQNVKAAQKYIVECEKDMGFLGSTKYFEARKVVDDYHDGLRESATTKTAEELLKEAIANYNSQVNDMSKFALSTKELKMFTDAMEEYRKQGNFFTPDEIRKMQEQAYDAGVKSIVE